jgi:hypothetical protein
VAGALGAGRDLSRAQPERRARGAQRAAGEPRGLLRAGHVPVSERVGAARRAPARLHRERRGRAPPAHAGVQRPPHDRLRRVRPPRRALCRRDRPASGGHDAREHREHAAPAAPARARSRSAAQRGHHRPRLLPLDAVDLPAPVRSVVRPRGGCRPAGRGAGRRPRRGHARSARRDDGRTRVARSVRAGAPRRDRRAEAGVSRRGDGQLVPGARHRAGQRGDHRRRAQRAGQLPGVPPPAASVDDADHRVRGPADRRPRHGRVARLAEGDAAQLDRAQSRRRRRLLAARPRGRGSLGVQRRAPTRSTASRSSPSRPTTRCSTRVSPMPTPAGRRRSGVAPGSRTLRPPGSTRPRRRSPPLAGARAGTATASARRPRAGSPACTRASTPSTH